MCFIGGTCLGLWGSLLAIGIIVWLLFGFFFTILLFSVSSKATKKESWFDIAQAITYLMIGAFPALIIGWCRRMLKKK